MKHKFRYLVEYVFLRIIAFIVRYIPYRAALAFGWLFAWLAFYVARFRVVKAKTRIREVFGDRFSSRETGRIAWMAWRNFVFGIVDLIRAPVQDDSHILDMIEDRGSIEKIRAYINETGRGAIIAVPHMGAWEMAAFAARGYGIPLFTFAAKQKNKLADDFMNKWRQATGVETIMRDSSATKMIIRRIKSGKVLAILPDLRSPTEGLSIRFLGKTANIALGMGFIAKQTGVPIFPAVVTRSGWMKHRCRMFDPIWSEPGADKHSDALRITQAVFDVFERCILDEPEQWFWFNKRWIFDPLQPSEPQKRP